MPISPEEQTMRRRATKQKQNAVARAKATHSKTEGEKEEFDNIFQASFSPEVTEFFQFVVGKKNGFVTRWDVRSLIRDKKMSVLINEDQPIIGGEKINVGFNGFTGVDGKPITQKIYRIVVRTGDMFAITFTWRFDKKIRQMQLVID